MKTSATNKKLGDLLKGIADEVLIPQPDFQRRLVWTNKDKLSFIETVLEGYPFPEIYIATGDINTSTGENIEVLVDGQQRITTLYQYFKAHPDLILSKKIPSYESLTEAEKREFLSYSVVIRDLGDLTIDEIKKIFQKINSTSYSLNAMEIHNSRFDGELKKCGEEVLQNSFFDKYRIFSSTDIKRMNDLRYSISLIVTVLSTYFTQDDAIEEYLEKYNEDFAEKNHILSSFNKILLFIEACNFAPNSRAFKKTDLFTLFIELYRATIREDINLVESNVGKTLTDFYLQVDAAASGESFHHDDAAAYHKVTVQGSNNRSNRIARGNIIYKLLTE